MRVSAYQIWTTTEDEDTEHWRQDQPMRVFLNGVEIDWVIAFDIEEGWVEHLICRHDKTLMRNKRGMYMWDRARGSVQVVTESETSCD
jgi:hypothetical protein